MEKTNKWLLAIFWVPILLCAILVALFETDTILPGASYNCLALQFHLLMIMELITVVAIPAALYLFKIKKVNNELVSQPAEALKKWGTLRLLALGIPMLVNTLFYYISMNVAYGYMAIILLICHAFVYPSKARCEQETTSETA